MGQVSSGAGGGKPFVECNEVRSGKTDLRQRQRTERDHYSCCERRGDWNSARNDRSNLQTVRTSGICASLRRVRVRAFHCADHRQELWWGDTSGERAERWIHLYGRITERKSGVTGISPL